MDNWTGDGALRSRIEGPLTRDENKLEVRGCWANQAWHLNIISFVFPLDIMDSIRRHTLQWFNPSADPTIWNLTSVGEFSSKSAQLSS